MCSESELHSNSAAIAAAPHDINAILPLRVKRLLALLLLGLLAAADGGVGAAAAAGSADPAAAVFAVASRLCGSGSCLGAHWDFGGAGGIWPISFTQACVVCHTRTQLTPVSRFNYWM